MAGHSKWANIQHRKSAQDAKRGKIFTKLIREITTAARISGGDPNSNPRLRLAIDKSLGSNMTRDTIDRAIKKGIGALDTETMLEIRYEGYGPGGVAVMVDCLTDNKNRTVGEVRHAFTKHGGNLGTDGSVGYLFTKQGIISFDAQSNINEDTLMELALEAGADDVISNSDGSLEVITTPDNYEQVKKILLDNKLTPSSSEITLVASTDCLVDLESAQKLLKMVDTLEDCDDVQNVYTNADISDSIMAELSK
ncbi:MAG: YebC/PmpR family DNA-binding transcriptional regulator [Gammaproteobacteria bacterium]|nr:YebC/PmpR family DNA-binding transcriptional regulator [Gammaproteobacteria bacterium]